MFYHLLPPLSSEYGVFNLFRYLTFRTGGAILTSFLIGFFLGKPVITWLKSKQKKGQPIREDGPEQHLLTKKGTPTMGGLLILLAMIAGTLLWVDWRNPYVWVVLTTATGFGCLGAWDDYVKLVRHSHRGVPGRVRFLLEVWMGLGASIIVMWLTKGEMATQLAIPYLKDILINLGGFYLPFAVFIIVAAANAVNLTDGLDGLAIVPVMIVAGCFCLIAYLVGNAIFAHYLQLPYVANTGELSVVCGALIGSGLAFLWYNAPPAKVFMGDTGSLAVGSSLGIISIITKHELILAVVGGLFVVETISVIIQVIYFKLTGKRIFLMAPIHHHFEKKGWAESTIVIRFWIISWILGLIGLASLKLR